MRWWQGIVVLAVATGWSPAQGAAAPRRAADPPVPTGRASADVHTEPRSRELFTACDGNGDDRLDLFEACEAIEALGDPKESKAFLRLDQDRDGYLSWPEFDQHFLGTVRQGSTFRVRTCRRLVPQAPEQQQARTATPLQAFLQLHDRNHDGGLDAEEIDQLVKQMDLPPALGSQLKALDLDKSGRVEETELAPWLEQLRGSIPFLGAAPTLPQTALPAPWSGVDANGDRSIDADELARALRRLDPGLARWAEQLFRRYDRNQDGKWSAEELPGAQKPAAGRTAAASSVRPSGGSPAGTAAAPPARS